MSTFLQIVQPEPILSRENSGIPSLENIEVNTPKEPESNLFMNNPAQTRGEIPDDSKKDSEEIDYSFFNPDCVTHDLFGKFYDTVGTSTPSENNLCVPGSFGLELINPFCQSSPEAYRYISLDKKRDFKGRPDIYRRRMLRAIKRFFYELFKYHNSKLFYRRLGRTQTQVVLHSLRDFCRVYITKMYVEEMAQFLLHFLKLRCSSEIPSHDSDAMVDGKKAYDCTYRYSIDKYDKLFGSPYFKSLIFSYISLQRLSSHNLKYLKSKEEWKHQSIHNSHKEDGFLAIISKYLHTKGVGRPCESLQEAYDRCCT